MTKTPGRQRMTGARQMHPADPNRSRNRSRPPKNKPDTNNNKKKGGLGRSFRTTSFQEDGSAAVPYNSRRETEQVRETEREREGKSFLLSGMESGGGATRYCHVCGGAERELGKKVGLFLFSLSLSFCRFPLLQKQSKRQRNPLFHGTRSRSRDKALM